MNVEIQRELGVLLLAALGAIGVLVRYIGVRLMIGIDDAKFAARRAESNTNGSLSKLIEENVRLKLECEQLRAIIQSMSLERLKQAPDRDLVKPEER